MAAYDPFYGRRLLPPLSHLKPTIENRYAMQLSVYRYILTRAYGIDVGDSVLAVFDSTGVFPHKVLSTPYFEAEAAAIVGPLCTGNAGDRDASISFVAETHTYSVAGEGPKQSATGVIGALFPAFDPSAAVKLMRAGRRWKPGHNMWGKTADEIKALWKLAGEEASRKGTALHNAIELTYTGGDLPTPLPDGYDAFMVFRANNPSIVPLRVEKPIYGNDTAGTPDMVYTDAKGNHVLVDWKYTKKRLCASNFGSL